MSSVISQFKSKDGEDPSNTKLQDDVYDTPDEANHDGNEVNSVYRDLSGAVHREEDHPQGLADEEAEVSDSIAEDACDRGNGASNVRVIDRRVLGVDAL